MTVVLCAALEPVLEDGRDGQVDHVGAGAERSNLEVVDAILAGVGEPAWPIRHVDDRPGHDRRGGLDPGRLERELGWAPARGCAAGLAATSAWYRDHPRRRDDVRSGEPRRRARRGRAMTAVGFGAGGRVRSAP